MRKYFFIVLSCLSLASCKKDRLEGEKSTLIGKWEWVSTVKTIDYCNPPTSAVTYTELNHGVSYALEFLQAGVVVFYQNGKQIDKKRIVFRDFSTHTYYDYSIIIYLNNKENEYLDMFLKDSVLKVLGNFFPSEFSANCGGCCSHESYFTKQ